MTSIVFIVTDDQPMGLLDAMPFTRAALRDVGVNLTSGVSPSPVCAMSRTSLLTAQYAGQDLGIWGNPGAGTALEAYKDATLATAIQDQGYHTGLFGKYMNGWSSQGLPVPPGWDVFCAIDPDDGGDGAYYDYTLKGTVYPTHYGSDPEDYSTDVLTGRAVQFIENAPASQPLFLYFSPYGVHGNFEAAPRHKGAWIENISLPPNVNADNTATGKPPWMRSLPLQDEAKCRKIIKDQHETIMSVDEGIQAIFAAMAAAERDDTLYLFAGDNGLMRGSHRLQGKYVPYKKATQLQMLARWDGHLSPGTTDDRVTTVLDLAATALDVAGATLPDSRGVPITQGRAGQFLEGGPDDEDVRPSYIGWRTARYLYVQWAQGYEELYDYDNDPHEMNNIAKTRTAKRDELRALALAACDPKPPGWVGS